MMPLRLLVVDDSIEHTDRLVCALADAGYDPVYVRADTLAAFKEALSRDVWDAIVAEHGLPSFDAQAALRELRRSGLDLPFLVVSTSIDEESAVGALRAGAHDFVRKGDLTRLIPALARELREARLRKEHREVSWALRESTERLELILEQMPAGMWATDRELRIVWCDGVVFRRGGAQPARLIGAHIGDLFADRSAAVQHHHSALRGVRSGFEAEFGDAVFNAHVEPLRDGADRIVGVLGAALDVTTERQAQTALSVSEQRQRALLDCALEVVVVIGRGGHASHVSPSCERLLGIDPCDRAQLDLLSLVHAADRPRVKAAMRKVMADPTRPQTLELRMRRGDGEWRTFETTAKNLLAVPGVEGVVINAYDVTERILAEERSRKLADRLKVVSELAATLMDAASQERLHRVLVESTAKVLAFDALSFALYDEAADALTYVAFCDRGVLVNAQCVRVPGTPAERVIRERRTLLTLRSDDPAAAGSYVVGTGIRSASIIRAPIIAAGRVLGILAAHSYEPDHYEAGDVEVLESIASITATALERIRHIEERRTAEQERSRLEERYRVLVDLSPDAIAVHQDERIVFVNDAALRYLGARHADELVGRSIWDFIDPAFHQLARSRLRAAAAGRPQPLVELRLRMLDGTVRCCELASAPVEFDGKPATYIVVRGLDERKRMDEQIALQTKLLNAVGEAVIATDVDGTILFWNRFAEELYGWPASEVVGRNVTEIVPVRATREQTEPKLARLRQGRTWSGELDVLRRDGTAFAAFITESPICDEDGQLIGIVGVSSDLTHRRDLEAQLRQSQKLEAVGRLAGGVAHDFNNVLMAIFGHADFALDALAEADPVRADLLEIKTAAERATNLTRQLLAFSRKQLLQPVLLDLDAVLLDMEKMLRRLIGEDIELVVRRSNGLDWVMADPGQIEQVVLNLVVNARDAMPRGGRIAIETANVEIGDDDARISGVAGAGRYVRLIVSDTGEGIAPENVARVFEPFFTTKDKTRGTGLGLSTVYGIVSQSGGAIAVSSETGKGAEFRIHLPSAGAASIRPKPLPAAAVEGGRETILLVEDDAAVRDMVMRLLMRVGYIVLPAQNGGDALRIAHGRNERIDLLLTDVVLPHMSGPELAQALSARHPQLRVIFMSGYTDDAMLNHGVVDPGTAVLPKPVSGQVLLQKLREVLDVPIAAAESRLASGPDAV